MPRRTRALVPEARERRVRHFAWCRCGLGIPGLSPAADMPLNLAVAGRVGHGPGFDRGSGGRLQVSSVST